jgi:TatD DNase family protein
MQLFDSHCHIHEADYPVSPQDVLLHANLAEVRGFICVGTNVGTSKEAVSYAAGRSNCWAAVGLHPHDAKDGLSALKLLKDLSAKADANKVVAIGECGLDYFYSHSSKADQAQALRNQIELALERDLPVIFHVRDGMDDFWPIFDGYKGIRGVMHSFTDNLDNLYKALERGLYIGQNGIVTFTKNDWQLQVAKEIPLQKLLLETDAPYLTPKPLRGRINEPANIRLVAEFLADLRGEPLEHLAEVTTRNVAELFALN